MSNSVFGIEQSVLGQPWRWRGGRERAAELASRAGLDDIVAQLFLARGASFDDLERLRSPTIRDWLPDPSIFRDMGVAAERIAAAVRSGEPVVVFGDYDVDGATSAALLIRFLRACGADATYYIPDRLMEGYGPSGEALERLAGQGKTLAITVDCGTQAFEALERACAAGLDVVVVDHHKASTALPACVAVVNPNRMDEEEGAAYGHLAAVGMAFMLAVAVNRLLRDTGWFAGRPEPKLMELLDLVALGTVADVVSLTGLNRAFVAQGLKVMAARRNIGMAALFDVAKLERSPQAGDLGFMIGPRINAGGRVGRSDLGVRLLTSEDPEEARVIAAELDFLNGERRALETSITEAAVAASVGQGDSPVAVIAGQGWHPGVIGIVASRIKDRLNKPAVIIAVDADGVGKGSGRSLPGVDLGGAVLAAKDLGLLVAGGGHAMAAGLTVDADKVAAFTEFLNDRLGADVTRAQEGAALTLDAALAPGGVCVELAEALDGAGPYGAGWPQPRVAAGPVTVVKCDVVGTGHVRVILSGADGSRVKAVAFRHADTALGAALANARGRRMYVAGRIKRDDWGAKPSAELHLDDAAWAD
ncbi:single-stranded-DNA-specific exonuclease RecJ [Sphingoaurantiacus capsulatus]|uniref:Single-stranded-DNA-specific exonuclease RecJ n=1 Tax=Sphingoaurantiacus capsulatus TaxID=1771310 RepID=A0ABV7XBQ7_9SPHN